ncbi:hypothetical protein Ancab_011329 [Ancistrocladus abbreviatus]
MVHSMKVGLAITLVSLFYYFEPLHEGFRVSGIWVVLTVVVVFEYSVGVNRVVATTLAGLLGVGAHRIAILSGEKGEPIVLGLCNLHISEVFPQVEGKIRLWTDDIHIDILSGVCLWFGLVEIFILEGFRVEYFKTSGDGMSDEKKAFMEEYNSRQQKNAYCITSLISQVNFANWEPRHGRYRHPWSQYQKIGKLARHYASTIEALNGYLHAEIQATKVVKSRCEGICMRMSTESGKALKELSSTINTMTLPPSSTKSHLEASKSAARDLNSTLGTSLCEDNEFSEVIPVATVASLLVDVLHCAEKIAQLVQGLASLNISILLIAEPYSMMVDPCIDNPSIMTTCSAPLLKHRRIRAPCLAKSGFPFGAILSSAISIMTQPPSSTKSHLEASKSAARDLNYTPGTSLCEDNEFLEVIPIATVASLLTDVLHCVEKIAELVQGLASLARFKTTGDDKMAPNRKPDLARQGALIRRCLSKGVEHVVMIEGLSIQGSTIIEYGSAIRRIDMFFHNIVV